MGRIKTVLIKRVSNQLIEKFKDRFSTDFEENKKIVKELVDYPSKKNNKSNCRLYNKKN